MAYRKQNFTDGQVLKAEHLNYIEAAIEDISDGIAEPTNEQVYVSVQAWLDKHPEATTTVEDGAISSAKLADGSVTTVKLANRSVTADKLAEGITFGGGGNTEALRIVFNILQRGVFTDNVAALMVSLAAAIEAGDTGGGTGGDTGGDPGGDDTPAEKLYYVTNDLTNVSTSNSTLVVAEGGVYTATLTAPDGFNLSTVTVIMGGKDVTSAVYRDGVISIVSVTGNIKITAVAKGVIEEVLTPMFGGDTYPDKNTYETSPKDMSGGSAQKVYAQTVLFEGASVSGGTLHVELDTTKIAYAGVRVYLVDSAGTPYKHTPTVGMTDSPVSGDVTDAVGWLDAGQSIGDIRINGNMSCKIPEGYFVKWIYIGGLSKIIIDPELSAAAKPIYAIVDAICFDGEIITAKIVKEV